MAAALFRPGRFEIGLNIIDDLAVLFAKSEAFVEVFREK